MDKTTQFRGLNLCEYKKGEKHFVIISYNKETGQGSYILKMEPGAKSLPHKHANYEEFLVLDGELIDSDNTIFKKGEFITFEPGSSHSSYTKTGCLALVFLRARNEPLKK